MFAAEAPAASKVCVDADQWMPRTRVGWEASIAISQAQPTKSALNTKTTTIVPMAALITRRTTGDAAALGVVLAP